MTKKDFETVAKSLAEIEAIIEALGDPQGIGASTLRIVVDNLGASLKAQYPRFDVGKFEATALPLQSERLKKAILSKLAKDNPGTVVRTYYTVPMNYTRGEEYPTFDVARRNARNSIVTFEWGEDSRAFVDERKVRNMADGTTHDYVARRWEVFKDGRVELTTRGEEA